MATFPAGPGITGLDTMMAGRERVTSVYLVGAEEPALIDTGPSASAAAAQTALEAAGIRALDLAHIVLTHIHLDHAGAVGAFANRFPRARVWVHGVGAPHLADPQRLNASTRRTYGAERMLRLFGPMEPVAPERIHPMEDDTRIDLGGRTLRPIHTPGHASHHVALQDSETGAVFTGDAVGVHLPDLPVIRPATPPPDFDLEAAIASIGRIRERARGTLLLSHFGVLTAVDESCERAVGQLRGWSEVARLAIACGDDVDVARTLREATAADYAGMAEADRQRFDIAAGYDVNAAGLSRYWRKRGEA